MAEKKLPEPKTVDVIEAAPIKSALGKAFKKEAKDITEALQKLEPAEIEALDAALKEKAEYELKVGEATYKLTSAMLEVKRYQKTMHVEEFVPNVIEPSFGIGRIMYAIFEHNFRVRGDDAQRTVSFLLVGFLSVALSKSCLFSVFLASSSDRPVEVLPAPVEQQPGVCAVYPSAL